MKDTVSPAQLQAARRGSEADIAAIIARFMPAIQRYARRAAGPGLDFDDAVQEGIIGLFFAIQNYSEVRRASFSTYALVCIQNAISTAKKTASRKKHAPLNYSVPLPDEQSVPGPEEQAIASEQVSQTLERARTLLSPLEKSVLLYYLNGLSHSEIALKTGKSIKAVENALARLRRKLR